MANRTASKPRPAKESGRSTRAPRLGSGQAIRDTAASLFLEKGYLGTSVDDIAAAAHISKQTVYTHFASKEDLLTDVVLGNADRVDAFINELSKTAERGGEIEVALRDLARRYLSFVIRPEVLRLRRLVISEATRFPDLARTYYERVPQRVYATFADLFRTLHRKGTLRVADPEIAAQHFVWLTLGMHLDRALFNVAETAVSPKEVDRIAHSAVDVFLRAYRRG